MTDTARDTAMPAEIAKLVEKLWSIAQYNCPYDMGYDRENGPVGCALDVSEGCMCVGVVPAVREAAAALEALSAEIERLRKALEHDQWSIIDRAIERYSNGAISDLHALGLITFGFLKLDAERVAARRALEGGENG